MWPLPFQTEYNLNAIACLEGNGEAKHWFAILKDSEAWRVSDERVERGYTFKVLSMPQLKVSAQGLLSFKSESPMETVDGEGSSLGYEVEK